MIPSKIPFAFVLASSLLLAPMSSKTNDKYEEAIKTSTASINISATTSANISTETTADMKIVVDRARELLGKPYVMGGDSEETGFDSSGLVVECFRKINIELPHKSSDIYRLVETIDNEEDLREGDLVFYKTPTHNNDNPIVSVSIYVGDGKVIHCANVPSGVELREMEKEKRDMILCYGRIDTQEPLIYLS